MKKALEHPLLTVLLLQVIGILTLGYLEYPTQTLERVGVQISDASFKIACITILTLLCFAVGIHGLKNCKNIDNLSRKKRLKGESIGAIGVGLTGAVFLFTFFRQL